MKNRAISVTMRTPGHDEELAAGFLLTEGIIARPRDVLRIEPCAHGRGGNVLNVILAEQTAVDFERLTATSLPPPVAACVARRRSKPSTSGSIRSRMTFTFAGRAPLTARPSSASPANLGSHGRLHAPPGFLPLEEAVVIREDVGRHNAVDKVLGYGFLHGLLPFDHHVLMVGGRSSFEIMQKAWRGGSRLSPLFRRRRPWPWSLQKRAAKPSRVSSAARE